LGGIGHIINIIMEQEYHVHHIVPKYAGGTNHKSNLQRVLLVDHANLHWYAYLGRLDLILEIYEKYDTKLTKKIIEKIPLGNKKDALSATRVAKNKIDGINNRGKNNYSYIDGRVTGKEFKDGHWNDIMKKYQAKWFQRWKENNPEAYQKKLERQAQYKRDNKEKMTESKRKWRAKKKLQEST
jgi:hypothetical protein